ncbi:hypothetical protein Pcinc_034439 [Petrolisthes cinctipes]|uniref:Trafficking protein particle complex subunit 2-like protein n=1 Tax=Petrolisthes cinctipes TaxID=88211 RepID=A0AAE1JVM4_PETCI|nr:hypothetical protein Pcinc_034439 [Petrolisthes cinctipes]
MCNRDEIMGRDGGEDTERGRGEDTERGRGEDTERGRGEDTDRSRGEDTERGRGEDTERGRGEDTERGRGEDTERGRGEDTDRDRSKYTDRERSKDTDRGRSKDTDRGRGEDMSTNSKDKNNGIKDKDSTSEDKCSTGEDKGSRSECRGSKCEHMDKKSTGVTSRLTTTEEVNNDHEGRVDDGWDWVVTFAAFMIDLFTGTAKHSFGVIYSRYFLKLGTSATQVSLIYNLAYVLSGFTAFLVGPVLPESMLRRVTFLSGLFYSVGIIASAFATSALGIFFCFTIVSGVTIMLLSVTSFAVVTKYFNNQSTPAALSFVTSGYGVGQFLMPLIITRLHMEYGFQGSILITGAIMLNLCVCAMLLHPVEWHIKKPHLVSLTRHGSNPQTYRKQTSAGHQTAPLKSQIQNRITELALSNLRLLKSPTTFVVSVVMSLNLFALINVGPTVPFAMMADGFKLEQAATCMSLAGICNLMSKLGLSLLTYSPGTNKILPMYIVGSLISAVSLVVFGQVSSMGWRAVSLGLSGCGGAMVMGLPTLLVGELLGPSMVLPVLTTVHFISAIVIGFMGFVLGEAHDLSGSYTSCFWFLGATLLMGVFLWVFLPIAAAFKRKRKVIGKENSPLYVWVGSGREELHLHYLAHTGLDVIQEKITSVTKTPGDTRDLYLGLLYATEEYKVFGYTTNTRIKFVIITDAANTTLRDNEIRMMFRRLHSLYTNVVCNPFYIPGHQITSREFDKGVAALVAGN